MFGISLQVSCSEEPQRVWETFLSELCCHVWKMMFFFYPWCAFTASVSVYLALGLSLLISSHLPPCPSEELTLLSSSFCFLSLSWRSVFVKDTLCPLSNVVYAFTSSSALVWRTSAQENIWHSMENLLSYTAVENDNIW